MSHVAFSKSEMDGYVEAAIEKAKTYVADNRRNDKLKGKTGAQTAIINDFLAKNPYDNEEVRGNVRRVFEKILQNAHPIDDGTRPNITYLSGPYGSVQLLETAADRLTNKSMIELKGLLSAPRWNFRGLKEALGSERGFYFTGDTPELYGKWRGLLAGMDVQLAEIAAKQRFHYTIDNSLAPVDDNAKAITRQDFARDKEKGKLRVFAVALTPDEAEQEAAKQGVAAKPGEAAQSAHKFHEFFNDIIRNVSNVTLVDRSGKVIYQQGEGIERPIINRAKWDAWEASFEKIPYRGHPTMGFGGRS